MTSFALDSSYRRPGGGRTLIAGSPLRLFRVSGRGALVLDALERGTELPAASDRLLERLVDAGAIHPRPDVPDVPDDATTEDLTIVVPARDQLPGMEPGAARMIVVDDASAAALTLAGAEIVRLPRSRGPGGARQAGLALVTTRFVAFVDTDVELSEPDLDALVAHLRADPRVAVVAPRVIGLGGTTALERYETVRSPLDLGPEAARVAPGTRVSYLPGAVLVCRVDAVRAVGGFDESLRYGEDVDLVWRLSAAGWRCRYEPSVVVRHRTRGSLPAWVGQRIRYGSSAAPLSRRHDGAVAPVRMSGWSAVTWAAIAAGATGKGLVVGVGTTLALVRKLRNVPPAECLRLAGLGHLFAGRLLLSTMLRTWWPVAAVLSIVSPRARRVLAVAAVAMAAADWHRDQPELDLLTYTALRRLDDLAYGAGVWLGALRDRTAAPLLPVFVNWPPR